MKKNIALIIIMALLLSSTIAGCGSNSSDSTKVEETAITQNQGVNYFMSGKIQADESAVITTKINARISSMNVDVGSVVNVGDTIITLDAKELEAQVAQAQAGVDVAQATLNKIKSGSRPEQIEQATAALESAKANYENAKTNNDRNNEVYNAGGISKAQLEQSETALKAAESAYKSAQATLDMLNQGETVESIAVSEAQVKSAQAALNSVQVQLENKTIISPVAGVVTAKNINNGELATVGTPLLSIVNLDTIVINAYIPASYINKISMNQPVVIKVSEIPDEEFEGEVSVIDSAIDSKNKNVLVKVKFNDKDPRIKPGMFAEIGIRE